MGRSARVFVVSGPSGVGKGTLVARLREKRPGLGLTVSATTRMPRTGEVEGESYYFISEEEFSAKVEAGEFLEWACVHGHRYGTLKSEVERNLAQGRSLVLEIDVQGGLNVRNAFEGVVLIFIAPPSTEELVQRLHERGTEDDGSISIRLDTAEREMELMDSYDATIVNDDLERALSELDALIESYEMDGGPIHDVGDET